jgi:hypothetical protein
MALDESQGKETAGHKGGAEGKKDELVGEESSGELTRTKIEQVEEEEGSGGGGGGGEEEEEAEEEEEEEEEPTARATAHCQCDDSMSSVRFGIWRWPQAALFSSYL